MVNIFRRKLIHASILCTFFFHVDIAYGMGVQEQPIHSSAQEGELTPPVRKIIPEGENIVGDDRVLLGPVGSATNSNLEIENSLIELRNAINRQEEALRILANDNSNDSHLSLLLTATGVLLAIVTIALTLLGILGFFGIKKAAMAKAKETADNVVKAEITKGTFDVPISEVGKRTLNTMLENGAFNSALETVAEGVVARLMFRSINGEDDLNQEEDEVRGGP